MQDIQGVGVGHLAEAVIAMLYGPWLDAARKADFVGVQTYTRVLVGPEGRLAPPKDAEMTAAGYEFYPQALGGTNPFCGRAHRAADLRDRERQSRPTTDTRPHCLHRCGAGRGPSLP